MRTKQSSAEGLSSLFGRKRRSHAACVVPLHQSYENAATLQQFSQSRCSQENTQLIHLMKSWGTQRCDCTIAIHAMAKLNLSTSATVSRMTHPPLWKLHALKFRACSHFARQHSRISRRFSTRLPLHFPSFQHGKLAGFGCVFSYCNHMFC